MTQGVYVISIFSILFLNLFNLFLACWVFIAAQGLSLVVEGRDSSLVAVLSLLVAVAFLVEHR